MMIRHCPIVVVVVAQLCLLAAIPLRTLRTRADGADVTLWTAPVDPYDAMSGYYVTLAYEAETTTSVGVTYKTDDAVWLTVRREEPAWTAVSLLAERPADSPDEVSLRAKWARGRAHIENADRLYIPESERERATKLLAEAHGRGLVDLRVGPDGDVSVIRLRVGDATFGDNR